jgi:hypothetical protein
MNNMTCVVVCGYAGDEHQIRQNLPYYLHHGCPVLILSPLDAPIHIKHPNVKCKSGGKRAYIGKDSLDRQAIHLKLMLDEPFQYFLANDADSVVLSSRLPGYLYAEPNILWSNEVSDAMHDDKRPAGYPYPHLAYQPPYFMNRHVIERLLVGAKDTECDPSTPFIDWCMMSWAHNAGLAHRNFPDGASCPTSDAYSFHVMDDLVRRHGRYFLHSIKKREVLLALAHSRLAFLKKKPLG